MQKCRGNDSQVLRGIGFDRTHQENIDYHRWKTMAVGVELAVWTQRCSQRPFARDHGGAFVAGRRLDPRR